MAVGDGLLVQVDTFLANQFGSWNLYTSFFATILLVVVAWPWFTWRDPELYPYYQARQANGSPIRQIGESVYYRNLEVPYGYPLRSGLGVKDPGAPKWSSGRPGDLRDIWRQAVRGPLNDDGKPVGQRGKIMTVLGSEKVVEHDLDDLTREINVIGKYLHDSGAKSVAICLSNSTEFLCSFFAAAFYGIWTCLIPFNLSPEKLNAQLAKVQPDVIIAEAGSFELEPALNANPSLKHVIWVTKAAANNHMDWNEVPDGIGGKVEVAVWTDLIDEKKASTSSDVLPVDQKVKAESVLTFWPKANGELEAIGYTSENIIAAVSGLHSALPSGHRLGPLDLVLPKTPLTSTYTLCTVLLALFSYSSVALNSVAGDDVALVPATPKIKPTVIIASPRSLTEFHSQYQTGTASGLNKLKRSSQRRALLAGNMPVAGSSVPAHATIPALSRLRLLLVPLRADAPRETRISATTVLTDLRLFLGARIGYALTVPGVAGAVCQTNILDYREKPDDASHHFGSPLSSLEYCLVGEEETMKQSKGRGKIKIRGPSVSGGEVTIDAVSDSSPVLARVNDDNTLSLE